MGRMWVMVVHHYLLHKSSAGSTSFEEVELDEDSTQVMKRFVIYLVFVCKHSVI
jgi:hypothetical protein